jgi:hypothetical protein
VFTFNRKLIKFKTHEAVEFHQLILQQLLSQFKIFQMKRVKSSGPHLVSDQINQSINHLNTVFIHVIWFPFSCFEFFKFELFYFTSPKIALHLNIH